MSAMDKNVNGGIKCPQRFLKQHHIPKYIIQLILATFYKQGTSWDAKCPRRTKLCATDKNVHGGQKCPQRTQLSATDKNVRDDQKYPQRFPKQHFIPKYIIQLILATFYSQGSS
jgi:hypothetical protein